MTWETIFVLSVLGVMGVCAVIFVGIIVLEVIFPKTWGG